MALRPEAERWLRREQQILAKQRLEAEARSEAFARCESGDLGHVFAIGSDICQVCGCRVPRQDANQQYFPS